MKPIIIYEKLSSNSVLNSLGINGNSIFELQSLDERPNLSCFLVINWQDSTQNFFNSQSFNLNIPRTMTLWVHQPWDITRDYSIIDKALNEVDKELLSLEQNLGTDSIRVSCVDKISRSGNLMDEAWKTIARNATYRVLYDEKSI